MSVNWHFSMNCPSKSRLNTFDDDYVSDEKKNKNNKAANSRQISHFAKWFHFKGKRTNEKIMKLRIYFTILTSNKKKSANDIVGSAISISVDFGRFNFSHLIIHEVLSFCASVYSLLLSTLIQTNQFRRYSVSWDIQFEHMAL